MWRGYEEALGAYGATICREWQRRSYADTCEFKIIEDLSAAEITVPVRLEEEICQAGAAAALAGRRGTAPQPPLRAGPQGRGLLPPSARDVPLDLPYVWPGSWPDRPGAGASVLGLGPGNSPVSAEGTGIAPGFGWLRPRSDCGHGSADATKDSAGGAASHSAGRGKGRGYRRERGWLGCLNERTAAPGGAWR
jgi:hypothetical protein